LSASKNYPKFAKHDIIEEKSKRDENVAV